MSRIRHLFVPAIAATAVVSLMTLSTSPVGAAPEEQTFATPGTFTFEVPSGVTAVTVEAEGAAGGAAASGGLPGAGGRTTATIAVTPGEELQINVGGQGGTGTADSVNGGLGGGNGGGRGGLGSVGGGGGGGASDVRRGGTDLASRVVVAGGGGGGGGSNHCYSTTGGAGGGATPGDGQTGENSTSGTGGGAGSAIAGGVGGAGADDPSNDGAAGDSGTGGAGGQDVSLDSTAGGGGGGGYFGGGGGGAGVATQNSFPAGGGGGGSAYAVSTATGVSYADGVSTANGSVTLTWDAAAPTTTTTAPTTTTTAPAGPAAAYGSDPGTGPQSLTTVQGESVTLSGSGWAATSEVTATMFSDPVELGVATTDSVGSFVRAFVVPADAAVGAHRIELTGRSAAGDVAVVVLELTVTAKSQGTSTPTARSSATPSKLSFVC